jgi:hypothetical protein
LRRRCTVSGVTPKSAAMSSIDRPSSTRVLNASNSSAGWRL